MIYLKYFLFFAPVFQYVTCANILALTTVVSPSHHIWHSSLFRGLANKGHNVTYLGAFLDEVPTLNITPIYLTELYEKMYEELTDLFHENPIETARSLIEWGINQCSKQLDHSAIETLLNYPSDFFDLILYDPFSGECLLPFVKKFGSPPLVQASPFGIVPYTSMLTGGFEYPAVIPLPHLSYTNEMTFHQRVVNFIMTFSIIMHRKLYVLPKIEAMAKTRFKFDYSSIVEIESNTSIYLLNNNHVIDIPRPLLPNIIPVAGLHISKSKTLPQDIQKFMDEAKEGVILFSLGTNVKSSILPTEKLNIIVKAFEILPFKILFKWEKDDFPNKPKNVMIKKWLPQSDILDHPNVRLFVTHCGALSIQELIFKGVPIVGIPFFMDQFLNMKLMVSHGFGLALDYHYLTRDSIVKIINEVATNSTYKLNIQRASRLVKDDYLEPLDRAIFWIEYVLRNGGAQHLHLPSIRMRFYQIYSIDIIVFLTLIFVLIIVILRLIINILYKTMKSKMQKIKKA